jgi:hypothetical protein
LAAPYLFRILKHAIVVFTNVRIRRFYERQDFSEYFIRTFYEDHSICHHSYFRRIFRRYESRFLGCFAVTKFVITSF